MDKMRGLTGMAMGVIYILVGIFMLVAENKLFNLGNDDVLTYLIASVAILYGLFRIWRGWTMRKNAGRR